MSRNISDKSSVTISCEEAAFRNTSGGKLLFTEYHGKEFAMLIKDNRLTAVSVLPEEESTKIGAVYIGRVKNVALNINACFVEIADKEICFLPLNDAVSPLLLNRKFDGRILEGDELPVQVVRDAQKTKQASVTSRINLSNEYFVLELGSDRINYSSKFDKHQRSLTASLLKECGIASQDNRLKQNALKNNLEFTGNMSVPVGMIVRTRAEELTDTNELKIQFQTLANEFLTLMHNAFHRSFPCCIKKAPEPFAYVLEQLSFSNEYDELVTDETELYPLLLEYAREHMPQKKVRLYNDQTLSLKNLYSIDTKLQMALSERVWLKSGGYIIIQPTEALTVIDVNSGKYEGRKGTEETALKINLEAAEEIALQLRLRNLSGIIIIDFINMKEESSRRELLQFMKTAVHRDRLQTTVVDITPLGLVELTRKKESKPLFEQVR